MRPVYLSPAQAALAAGVKPATIRDWVRRGLLKRTGLEQSKPYLLTDVLNAADAPKPRRAVA